MDPNNDGEFCKEKSDYWGQVDLYIGGSENMQLDICYILDSGQNFYLTGVLLVFDRGL